MALRLPVLNRNDMGQPFGQLPCKAVTQDLDNSSSIPEHTKKTIIQRLVKPGAASSGLAPKLGCVTYACVTYALGPRRKASPPPLTPQLSATHSVRQASSHPEPPVLLLRLRRPHLSQAVLRP